MFFLRILLTRDGTYDTIFRLAISLCLLVLVLESYCESRKINIVIIYRKPSQRLQFHWKYYVIFINNNKQRILATLFQYLWSYAFDTCRIHFSLIEGSVILLPFFTHWQRKAWLTIYMSIRLPYKFCWLKIENSIKKESTRNIYNCAKILFWSWFDKMKTAYNIFTCMSISTMLLDKTYTELTWFFLPLEIYFQRLQTSTSLVEVPSRRQW